MTAGLRCCATRPASRRFRPAAASALPKFSMRCPRCGARSTPGRCHWPTLSGWPTRLGALLLRRWTPLLICWPWPASCRRIGSPARLAPGRSATSQTTDTATGLTSVGAGTSRLGSNKTAWCDSMACWTPRPAPVSAIASKGATAHRLRRPPHRAPLQRRQTAAPRSHGAHRHHRPMADAHRPRWRLHRLRRQTRPMPSPPHRPLHPTTAHRYRKPRPRLLALPPQHPRPPLASRPPPGQTGPRTARPPGPARPRGWPTPPRPRTSQSSTTTTGPHLPAESQPATSQSPGRTGPDPTRISSPGQRPRPAPTTSPRPLPSLTKA